MNTAIGISAKDPESAQNAAAGPAFLLMFASNAVVPPSTLPTGCSRSPATSR